MGYIDIVISGVLTSLAGAGVGAALVWFKNYKSKEKVIHEAVKALSHDSFYRQCRNILQQDSMTQDELENLNYLHDAYKALGMNGTGEELYIRCLERRMEGEVH